MDFSKLNWSGDFLYSELLGLSYEVKNDFTAGHYTIKDFPEVNLYINTEEGKIIKTWLEQE